MLFNPFDPYLKNWFPPKKITDVPVLHAENKNKVMYT